jgi:hypothetical protein
MRGDTNPEDNGNSAQAPGSEKRSLASKENLPSIRELMLIIRQEKELEAIIQGLLVMRLQALLNP